MMAGLVLPGMNLDSSRYATSAIRATWRRERESKHYCTVWIGTSKKFKDFPSIMPCRVLV